MEKRSSLQTEGRESGAYRWSVYVHRWRSNDGLFIYNGLNQSVVHIQCEEDEDLAQYPNDVITNLRHYYIIMEST